MKTIIRSRIIIICLILLGGVCSCERDNPAYNRENIKAFWLLKTTDGSDLSLSQLSFYKFDANGKVLYGAPFITDEGALWKEVTLDYIVDCCTLTIRSDEVKEMYKISSTFSLSENWDIKDQKDSTLSIELIDRIIDGVPVDINPKRIYMEKVDESSTFATKIEGVWEVIQKDGSALNDFRIEFQKDNSLIFYSKENDLWVAKEDNRGLYYIYNEYLCLNQFNNTYFGEEDRYSLNICTVEINDQLGLLTIVFNDFQGDTSWLSLVSVK